jgi:hypothetical protein
MGASEGCRAGDENAAVRLAAVLGALLDACACIAYELRPFLPLAAERINAALADLDVQQGRALFPKAEVAA